MAVYENSWKEIIASIKNINPKAKIVATEFYNPLYGISGIDNIADKYINKMNNILKEQSNDENEYYIAKIYNDFNSTDPIFTNMHIDYSNFSITSLDPHPNKEGHNLIARKIIERLDK